MSDFIWFNPFGCVREETPKLDEVFENWDSGGGIFAELSTLYTMPWDEYLYPDLFSIDPTFLDILYFGTNSGSKFASPLVRKFLSDGVLPASKVMVLAQIIYTKYALNWARLWDTVVAEYNPLNNYDITEERELSTTRDDTKTRDGSVTRTGTDSMRYGRIESTGESDDYSETVQYGKTDTTTHGKQVSDSLLHGETETVTHGKSVTDTTQHGKTDTTTHGKSTTDNAWKFGFNAGDNAPAPSDRDTVQESGTTAVATTGTDTETEVESGTTTTGHSGTDARTIGESGTTRVAGSGSDSTENSRTVDKTITNSGSDVQTKNLLDENKETETLEHAGSETEEITRSGNIGVTTTQKLVQEERELWMWNFFETVFSDLDTILALQIHNPEGC